MDRSELLPPIGSTSAINSELVQKELDINQSISKYIIYYN
jgi:hypothetical protein